MKKQKSGSSYSEVLYPNSLSLNTKKADRFYSISFFYVRSFSKERGEISIYLIG
jgi:hypothetical protein